MFVNSLSWCSEYVIHNSTNARGRKHIMSILFTWLRRWRLLLCFSVVFVNPCLIIYHCCQKECWISFLSSLRVLPCTDTIHLQPVTQQAGHELVAIVCSFTLPFKMLWADSDEILHMLGASQWVFCFRGHVCSLVSHFYLFCYLMNVQRIAFVTRKPLK